MAPDLPAAETQPLLDWPYHWDNGLLSHPYGLVEPAARKLFCERLKVMKRVLAKTFELHGFDVAAEVRDRLYHSRSARIASAIEAGNLGDEELSELFRNEGAMYLPNFRSIEAPANIWLEGLLPFDYADDGEFLHVEREVAAFGVGLLRLDYALGDIM